MAEYGMKPMLNFTNLPPRVEPRKRRRKRAVKTPTVPRVKTVALSQASHSQGEASGVAGTSEMSLKWVSPQFVDTSHAQGITLCGRVPAGTKQGQRQLNLVPLEVRGGRKLSNGKGRGRKGGRRMKSRRTPLHELDDNSLEDFESPKDLKSHRNMCMSLPSARSLVLGPRLNTQHPEENQFCGSSEDTVPFSTDVTSNHKTSPKACGDSIAVGQTDRSEGCTKHYPSEQTEVLCSPHKPPQSGNWEDISVMVSNMSLEEASIPNPIPSQHLPIPDRLVGSLTGKLEARISQGLGAHFDITTFNPNAASTPAAAQRLRPDLKLSDTIKESRDLEGESTKLSHDLDGRSHVQTCQSDSVVSVRTPVRHRSGWRMGRQFKNSLTVAKDYPCSLPGTSPCRDTSAPPVNHTSNLSPSLSPPSVPDSLSNSPTSLERSTHGTEEHHVSILAVETPKHLWGVPALNKWNSDRQNRLRPSVEDTFG